MALWYSYETKNACCKLRNIQNMNTQIYVHTYKQFSFWGIYSRLITITMSYCSAKSENADAARFLASSQIHHVIISVTISWHHCDRFLMNSPHHIAQVIASNHCQKLVVYRMCLYSECNQICFDDFFIMKALPFTMQYVCKSLGKMTHLPDFAMWGICEMYVIHSGPLMITNVVLANPPKVCVKSTHVAKKSTQYNTNAV